MCMRISKKMLVGKAAKGERGAGSGKRKVLQDDGISPEDGIQMICWGLRSINFTLSQC